MPESTASIQAGGPSPGDTIEVTKCPVDWGSSGGLEGPTCERLSSLGDRFLRGAWFLNPMFTVFAHVASAAFFRAAFRARGRWLLAARQVLGNRGLRHQARAAEQRGRRAAYLDIIFADPGKGRPQGPDGPLRLSALSTDQRAEVFSNGKLAKQLAFSGIMIIDGELVPPRAWQARAERLLHPQQPVVTRRHVDLVALGATHDLGPLARIAREALQAHVDQRSSHVIFVLPNATLSAPSITSAFHDNAEKIRATWCHLLTRALGPGPLRRLQRAADLPTRMLAFHGTLVIGGQCYLPGCWPDEPPTAARLKKAPFGSPTVPLSFLGLPPPLG